MELYKKLLDLDCSDKVEKKNNMNYLSWSYAWGEVLRNCPDATYQIQKFDNLPYVFDPKTGYMCFTTVCIEGITHEMWLPVMDFRNKAIIEGATMFEINKTLMRCLVKNLAMFGLGLYIYAGEDLPEEAKAEKEAEELKAKAEALIVARESEQKAKDDLKARKDAAKKCEDDLRSSKSFDEFMDKFIVLTVKQQEYYSKLKEEIKLKFK